MLEISRQFQSTPKSRKGDFYPVKRLIFIHIPNFENLRQLSDWGRLKLA